MIINSINAFKKLNALDEKLVGTPDYVGVYWFWNYEYRHVMRDATLEKRKEVHHAFLRAGLEISEKSEAHNKIIRGLFENSGY